MRTRRRALGFTLIEMLTVIAIIMLVMALALPNFVEMMRGRKWSAALGNIQLMITRARAFACTSHIDASVEFYITPDNGTSLWIESEEPRIEALIVPQGQNPPMYGYGFVWGPWAAAAGGYGTGLGDGVGVLWQSGWQPIWPPDHGYEAWPSREYDDGGRIWYGDNAHQSEVLPMGSGMTIDVSQSLNFLGYDKQLASNCRFGKDDYPDVRVGINGALVQTVEPTICLKEIGQEKRQSYVVVRCTGRLVRPR